jgi:hypothetical protein
VHVTACSTHGAVETSATTTSSSISQHVKWGHLLRLPQFSPQWAAAAAAFGAEQPNWDTVRAIVLRSPATAAELLAELFAEASELPTSMPVVLPSTEAATEQIAEQYAEAIKLCRTLAAEAPVTAVCNNPSCTSLTGVSEAAAACKACAGCKCRYCSVACQRADWKRHKSACTRLAAAGETCA